MAYLSCSAKPLVARNTLGPKTPSDHVSFIDNIHMRKQNDNIKEVLYVTHIILDTSPSGPIPRLWSLLGVPEQSRSCGPGIVCRSPGGGAA